MLRPKSLRFLEAWANVIATSPPTRSVLPILAHFRQRRCDDHPRLREMNVQFPAQTVRATVIGAGAHTLSLSGSTIWLEGVQLPLRNLPGGDPGLMKRIW